MSSLFAKAQFFITLYYCISRRVPVSRVNADQCGVCLVWGNGLLVDKINHVLIHGWLLVLLVHYVDRHFVC